MALHLLTAHSLAGEEIARQINEVVTGTRYLHLCFSRSIQAERSSSPLFRTASRYKKGAQTFTLATFFEFEEHLRQGAFCDQKTIRASDEKYILLKAIRYMFKADSEREKLFMALRAQLYELYTFLLFHEVELSSAHIQQIGVRYAKFETEIFELYGLFRSLLQAVVTNVADDKASEILGDDVSTKIQNLDLLHNRMKKAASARIEKIDVLILDGALFFNDLRLYLIEEALRQEKQVYLTAKDNDCGDFLIEVTIPELFAKLNRPFTPPARADAPRQAKTALQYAKSHFRAMPNEAASPLLRDGSLRCIKPFSSREKENGFIAHEISRLLETHCGKDKEKLLLMLRNDIAVVASRYAHMGALARAFKDCGLFIYNPKLIEQTTLPHVDLKTFERVYFKRLEFLNEEIAFADGTRLTFSEKNKLFDEVFDCITPRKKRLPITTYPIGQYVIKIYDILLNGVSTQGFKEIIFSNWQYTVHGGTKWDQHLSAFEIVEVFYEKKNTLEEWLSVTNSLLSRKDQADSDRTLRYHPLHRISKDSLHFFRDLLLLLQALIAKMHSVSGGMQAHVSLLKEVLVGQIPEWKDPSFEQEIVLDLLNAVDTLAESSIVQGMHAEDFAENLQAMFREYAHEPEADQEKSPLYFDTVSLTQISNFKYCFLPAFESEQYPRPYKKSHAFHREVLEILANPTFGIQKIPRDRQGLGNHIRLEEYLFKNVLDFTNEALIITMTESGDERKNSVSPFVHYLATLFDCNISWEEPVLSAQEFPVDAVAEKTTTLYLPKKEQYTLTELMMFQLCPRRFLHQQRGNPAYTSKFQLQFYFAAILFAATTRDFCRYNRENRVIYSTSDTKAAEQICDIFSEVYDWYLPLFPMFSKHELLDIRRTAQNRLIDSVSEMKERGIRGERFTVVALSETPTFMLNGFVLTPEYDTVIYDMEHRSITRSSQSGIFLDFLALKTVEKPGMVAARYRELKMELAHYKPETDRVNLTYKMLNKINVQFESGNESFVFGKDGGAERVNAIVDEISNHNFAYARACASGYCAYCPVQEQCKESAVTE